MVEAAFIALLGLILRLILEGGNPVVPVSHGAGPRLKKQYAQFRFSVRTLFVAMTLAAVVLWILVWASH